MHLRFLFFKLSSHFLWDTYFKQSFHLDEKWFLWLIFCSFHHWSNSFYLCRTLHVLDTSLSCIYASCIVHRASFYMHCFLFLFVDLTLLLCFWVSKYSKTYKKYKISKVWSLVLCHFTCWVWPNIFVLMT